MPRTLALICLLFVASGALADDAAAGLARNAWYWQARARSDKAEDAWKEVLQAAPDNPDALAAIGGFAARAGRLDEARTALSRLEKASPGHPDVPVLRREIQLGARFAPLLAQARKLVHEGHPAEGAAKYRELFGEAGPPGDLALEYYQTVAGAEGGFTEARDGLRRLSRRAPAEPRFRLALAKLLTYREETRREGIGMLASLARDPAVGREAETAQRQAMLWLVPDDRDLPLFRAWAKTHPRDPEVSQRLERSRNAGTLKQGFAALERGDIEGARRAFVSAGADPDARLGLALIAQREASAAMSRQQFARAQGLLEEARKLAPQRRDLWAAPLQSAVFWRLMQDAQEARAAGRDADAEARLGEASAHAPKDERWKADLALGDLQLSHSRPGEAERRYRDVLSVVPDQPEALRALAGILVSARRYEEAVPVNDRLARVAPGRAFHAGWLRAEILRVAASQASAAHDFAAARTKLERARQADPSDVWVLHDLANVLLQLGATPEAETLVAELLRVAPGLPEARTTQARLLVAEGRDSEALQLIDAIGPRDPSLLALRRRLYIQVRTPQVLSLAAAGERVSAEAQLAALEKEAGDEPDLLARIAVAWGKLGDRAHAVTLMRRAMTGPASAARGARLELAAALLQAGEDKASTTILDGLERDKGLSPQERRSLGELRVALAVHAADAAHASGDANGALQVLQPVLRAYPDDPRLIAAEARALEPVDRARSHALYLAVLRAAPGNLEALRGAADTTGDAGEALALANEATRLHPDDARAWELSGRAAERNSDDAEAMARFQRALRIARTPAWVLLQPGVSAAAAAEGTPRLAAATPDPLREQLARDMQRIDDRHRPSVDGGFEIRQRSGEAGLGRLSATSESIETTAPLGYAARASLRINEIQLDPGAMAPDAAARFGGGGLGFAPGGGVSGTELHLGYEGRNLSAELGTTPLGFPVFSLLGGARVHGSVGPFSLSAGASRRSVTESVLSWAGATDPATGQHWGGVVLDSGRLDARFTSGRGTIYAYGEGGRLIGLRVADNLRAAAGGGAELTLYDGELGRIGGGPDVTALSFQRNLGFFTLGHGGYFSPQRFVHGGLALRWHRDGALHWDALVEPGYDYYEEAHEDVFPLSPDGRLYAGKSSGGLSFNGSAFVGIGLSHGFELGLTAAMQQAPEFQELRAGIALRFGPH